MKNRRTWFNGGGIGSYETDITSTSPLGVKECTIKDCFVYANFRTSNPGNSSGIVAAQHGISIA